MTTDALLPDLIAPEPTPEADPRDRFFDTAHLSADLARRTVRGGAVTLSSQAIKFVLQMGSTAILGRLLTPADFGLIAMVTVVTGFVEMFKDAGLSMATVQREKITHAQVSTLFWINVGLSIAIMLIIAALAPVIGWFYHEPRLTKITLALSTTMIFGGLTVQHQALLRRKMQFSHLAIIEVISMAVGIAVALLMARQGCGYWSLVGMMASGSVTTAAVSILISGWIPGMPSSGVGVCEMLSFGSNLAGFSLVNYFARNADNFLIGWRSGAGPLGLYSRAYSLLMMPIQQINAPIGATVLPALCRLQREPERFAKAYLRALKAVAWITMPVAAVAIGLTTQIILIVLGRQWIGAVPVFRALALSAMLQPVCNTVGWVYQSLGRGQQLFRWGIYASTVSVTSFIVGLPWGIFGVAISYSISFVLALFLPCLWFATRGTSIRFESLFKVIVPPLAASIALAVLLYEVSRLSNH